MKYKSLLEEKRNGHMAWDELNWINLLQWWVWYGVVPERKDIPKLSTNNMIEVRYGYSPLHRL